MNNKDMFAITVATGAVVITTVKYIKIVREERRKRAAIKVEEKLQLHAIVVAGLRVSEKIHNGGFDRRMSIDNIMADFDFEIIAAREE